MLQTLTKVDDRRRAERQLATQEKAIALAFNRFVAGARKIDAETLLAERAGIEAVLRRLDAHVSNFAAAINSAFIDAASAEVAALSRRLTFKATASVQIAFDPGDDRAAALMRQNKLNLVRNLTAQQRSVTRQALEAGMQRGLGIDAIARMFRNSIGLTDPQQQALDRYRAGLEASRTEQAFLQPGETAPLDAISPAQAERMVGAKQQQMIAARAEAIARTESLRIVNQAREEGLRQSLEATGTPTSLVVREWASAHDARTREAHAEADGQRRYLDEAFDVGGERILRPGDGSARNSINCRCTTLEHIADTPEEAQRLRADSPS